MAGFEDIAALIEQQLWIVLLIFCRVGTAVSFLPAFGEQSVPVRIRLAIAVVFSVLVAPIAGLESDRSDPFYTIIAEILNGLVLGILLRLFILGLQTAGTIAAQSTSLSQLMGGAGVEPLPALGHVLVVSAIALAVISGLHISAIEFFVFSYQFLMFGEFPSPIKVFEMGTRHIAKIFELSFALAAPFVVVSIVYNLILGGINRAMPQLMVAFVGAPLISAVHFPYRSEERL